MYADIKHLELLKFKGCDNCYECCKKPMAPLILNDFEKVYKYFPILIAKLDFFKPVMLLSNEISCPYLRNGKCTIYENRPPACKIYPFSPWYDSILLDIGCKGVGTYGNPLPLNEREFKNSEFYEERFENITEKITKTSNWIKNQTLKPFKTLHGIELFTLDRYENAFAELMKLSHKNLSNYFN
jgi:hypothetical protein